jgi:DNA-directed RNA polymerase subunit RPC12/RpoP
MGEQSFPCPHCGGTFEATRENNGYVRCRSCGERSHEKVERHRDDLTDLAESDLATSSVASLLIGRQPDEEWP